MESIHLTVFTDSQKYLHFKMSRTIEVGDLAVVRVGDQDYPLKITGIVGAEIIAGDYRIVPIMGQWQVQNYPYPHTVAFYPKEAEERPTLTGVRDVDRLILLELSGPDLLKACQTRA